MSNTSQNETTRTIVVTANPALIPNEDTTSFCLTRRNVFDIIIAIILVVGIIYYVIQMRKERNMGFDMGYGQQAIAPAMALGNDMNRMGAQIAGAIKKMFK